MNTTTANTPKIGCDMRSLREFRCLALIAGGLALSACDKPDDPKNAADGGKPDVPKVAAGDARYVTHGGLAYDKTTNLTWQRCSFGMQWSRMTEGPYVGCLNIAKAFNFDDAQQKGDGQWRVPTEQELESLVLPNSDQVGPLYPDTQMDTVTFPDVKGRPINAYWSSTTLREVALRNGKPQSELWPVDFNFIIGKAT